MAALIFLSFLLDFGFAIISFVEQMFWSLGSGGVSVSKREELCKLIMCIKNDKLIDYIFSFVVACLKRY